MASNEEEVLRCEAAGGFVSTESGSPRVGGNLEVTRSFGDFDVKGISASPHVQTVQLTAQDLFVIIASDGLWDVVAPEEAVRSAAAMMPRRSVCMCAPVSLSQRYMRSCRCIRPAM